MPCQKSKAIFKATKCIDGLAKRTYTYIKGSFNYRCHQHSLMQNTCIQQQYSATSCSHRHRHRYIVDSFCVLATRTHVVDVAAAVRRNRLTEARLCIYIYIIKCTPKRSRSAVTTVYTRRLGAARWGGMALTLPPPPPRCRLIQRRAACVDEPRGQ